MITRFKALSAIPLAVLAPCSALVPAALAEFEAESSSPTLSVSSNSMQSFKLSSTSENTIECTTVNIDGTIEGTSTTKLRVEPTYGSCEKFLGMAVDVHENGCEYILHLANSATLGPLSIECPTATGIQITVSNLCRYEVDSQTSLNLVSYSALNFGTTREVEAQLSVTGVLYTRTTSHPPGICPNGFATGTITGNLIITGTGILHIGLFLD
jgi:hypothetical protein